MAAACGSLLVSGPERRNTQSMKDGRRCELRRDAVTSLRLWLRLLPVGPHHNGNVRKGGAWAGSAGTALSRL
ncbi:hypothetical protein EYF80_041037 [Liparis tanakae]|uniref:Uncharacterized protein n=1 Tax=Liparis tanakae TaxID=230148 RepID=A0A4Z2G733_9TELE|nr:hypothetical protein EYF80_041037 [Liparis tanakae]